MAAEDRPIPHLARPRGWYLPSPTIMGEYSLAIEESDRQLICLALAKLQQECPGWDYAIGLVAAKLPNGAAMLADFLNIKARPASV